MKLTKGLYKTRKGGLAVVAYVNNTIAFGMRLDSYVQYSWYLNGRYYEGEESNADLVELVQKFEDKKGGDKHE